VVGRPTPDRAAEDLRRTSSSPAPTRSAAAAPGAHGALGQVAGRSPSGASWHFEGLTTDAPGAPMMRAVRRVLVAALLAACRGAPCSPSSLPARGRTLVTWTAPHGPAAGVVLVSTAAPGAPPGRGRPR
jgi:hypothetical protein